MANFLSALPFVLNNEVIGWPVDTQGRPLADIAVGMARVKAGPLSHWFTDDQDDPGGATAWGITLKKATEYGITTVDALKAITPQQLMGIYKSFWRFDKLEDQRVATKLLDMAVNMGLKTAIEIAQREAGSEADGLYGPKTEAAINACPPTGGLLRLLCVGARYHYENVIADRPASEKYRDGWMERASEIPA